MNTSSQEQCQGRQAFSLFVFLFASTTILPLSHAFSSSNNNSNSNNNNNNLLDAANMALQNSPTATKFVTNRMCPFAQKAWCALEASGVPFEMQEISLYGAGGKPDWFWKLNPAGTVPVLVAHGGAAVFPDSDDILDQFQDGGTLYEMSKKMASGKGVGGPLYPPADRSDVRQAIDEWRQRINKMLPVGKKAVLSGKLDKNLKTHLASMNDAVVGPYLASQRLTTADCHAFPFLWRLAQEYPSQFQSDYPALQEWLDFVSKDKSLPLARTVQSSWWWWW